MAKVKAWVVREKDMFCATVVFAETRGKARALALHTDACEDADWLDIDVHALVKRVLELVNGKITVASKLNQGSIFVVSLKL